MPLRPRTPDQHTRSRLKAFYASSRAYADQQAQHDASYFRKFRDVVVHTIPEQAADVLEVDTGSGGALHPLVEQRPEIRVVALDLSPSAMAKVQRRGVRTAWCPCLEMLWSYRSGAIASTRSSALR